MPSDIHVTKSFLPPFDEFVDRLKSIWRSGQLTNNGPLVRQLEHDLRHYLDIDHVILLSNGDAGLRIAIRSLALSGEIITTPFSYVSTLSSILWSGLTPVFADIEPDSLTIDPDQVETAITPRTSAILATHVYGIPCHIERLDEIAKRHGLKIIYDAAHAFGVQYCDQGILNYGDVSMISLHATKIFHSAEGGLLATNHAGLAEQLAWRRSFGHKGHEAYHGIGINAKMSELHAAMGLCVLRHMERVIDIRRSASNQYDQLIADANLSVTKPLIRPGTDYNFSYYPILFDREADLRRAVERLTANRIFPRRYFFPSLNCVEQFGQFDSMPVSESVARRVLCLPLSAEITSSEIEQVVFAIKASQ